MKKNLVFVLFCSMFLLTGCESFHIGEVVVTTSPAELTFNWNQEVYHKDSCFTKAGSLFEITDVDVWSDGSVKKGIVYLAPLSEDEPCYGWSFLEDLIKIHKE